MDATEPTCPALNWEGLPAAFTGGMTGSWMRTVLP
jgi:hypothetical protein